MRQRRAPQIGLLAALMVIAAASPSAAANLVDAGWWWRLQGDGPVALPAPPNVPDGALMVQGAPDGPSAIAAMRFSLSSDEAEPVLTLRVTDGSVDAGEAVLLGCAPTEAWSGGPAQTWDSRPVYDADRCVTAQPSDDATTFTLALGTLQDEQGLEVVLAPGTVEGLPDGANGSSFTLVFAAPTADDLATSTCGSGCQPVTAPPPPVSAAEEALAPPPPSVGSISSPGVGFTPPPVAPATPARPAPASVSVGTDDATQLPTQPSVDQRPLRSSAARAVALGVLAVALLAGWLLWHAPPPLAALLARAGWRVRRGQPALVDGGLGRFRRPRDGRPPGLI